MMKKLFAANISPVYNFDNPKNRYEKFVQKSSHAFRILIHSILLYDKIVIPTQDFLTLTILVNILGEKSLIDLFKSNFIQFVRINGSLGYAGNGNCIQSFQVLDKDKKTKEAFADIEKTITWALNGSNLESDNSEILRFALEATNEIRMESFVKEIREETYNDILKSDSLSSYYSIRNKHLNSLEGVGPNQFRIFGGITGDWKGDEVDHLMSLANANLEIKLAQENECDDSSTSNQIGHILKAKAERIFEDPKTIEAFTLLQEIEGIPDIGEGFYSGQIGIAELLKIKESKNGEQFRNWFHDNSDEDPHTILKEYNALLREVPKIKSLPTRILRFIVCNIAGLIPGIGPVVSAVDSFFVESVLKGKSPKYFIDDLRRLGNRI